MARKAWTVYAALLTVAVVIGEVDRLRRGFPFDFRAFANLLLTAVLLAATWGYALGRPIGAHYYWRAACWVVLLATLATLLPAILAGGAAVVTVAILLPLLVPAFVASFLYAYRSPELWADRR